MRLEPRARTYRAQRCGCGSGGRQVVCAHLLSQCHQHRTARDDLSLRRSRHAKWGPHRGRRRGGHDPKHHKPVRVSRRAPAGVRSRHHSGRWTRPVGARAAGGRAVVTFRTAVLPGDGIGPEVIGAAMERFRGDLGDIVMIDAGAERYLRTGEVLTGDDLATIASCDALLFGAVGDPRVPDGILERGIILRLRKELDLYVNLRPFPTLGVVFVRENTEGPYAGVGTREGDKAFETSVNTSFAVARCVRYAFELAASRSG